MAQAQHVKAAELHGAAAESRTARVSRVGLLGVFKCCR
jgi:hypothetical protein